MKNFQGLFTTYFIISITFALISCGSDSAPSGTEANGETFEWLKENIHTYGYGEINEIYSPPSSFTARKDELSLYDGQDCLWQICSYEVNTKNDINGEINYIKNHFFNFFAQDIDPKSIKIYPFQNLGYLTVEMRTLDGKKLVHWRDKSNKMPEGEWVQSNTSNANFVIGNDRELAAMAAENFKKAILECQNRPRPLLTSQYQAPGLVQPCMAIPKNGDYPDGIID